jgi:hypothetical protein
MKKSIIFHLVVLVVAAGVAAFLAHDLKAKQDGFCKSREQLSRAPLAGFHKLLADIKWMQFIQYCGRTEKFDDQAVAETNVMLEELFRLDPDFGKAYETGAMMIYTQDPASAIKMLEKAAENPMLKTNWRIPYLAGFVHMRQVKGKTVEDLQHARKAKIYFDQALAANASQGYVLSSRVRADAALMADKPPKLAELIAWQTYYEGRRSPMGGMPAAPPFVAGSGKSFPAPQFSMEYMGFYGPDRERVVSRIVNLAQQCRAEMPDNPEVMKVTGEVVGKLLSDTHLCTYCYAIYGSGDHFCKECGKPVATYGVCPKCGEAVSGGKFCIHCGQGLVKK